MKTKNASLLFTYLLTPSSIMFTIHGVCTCNLVYFIESPKASTNNKPLSCPSTLNGPLPYNTNPMTGNVVFFMEVSMYFEKIYKLS